MQLISSLISVFLRNLQTVIVMIYDFPDSLLQIELKRRFAEKKKYSIIFSLCKHFLENHETSVLFKRPTNVVSNPAM